ncbi:hypothetical protein [Paracoccus sp. (in: a-proteobacteria)]|uniref:hypothetical protein n=1 Tax=Paracoccus sp. TaxID=267 RepID=UPI00396C7537
MGRVTFTLDGAGPFEGTMSFSTIGDGEVQFIGIPLHALDVSRYHVIAITPDADESFVAPVLQIVTEQSPADEQNRTMSGFVQFETL